jgi:hypothetical protein
MNVAIGGTFLGGNHFPVGPVFVLTTLVLLTNPILIAISKKLAFTGKELAVAFLMMLVASGIPFSGLARYLFPSLVVPRYYATPENEWKAVFGNYLSPWLIPSRTETARGYAEGIPGEALPLGDWVLPLLTWTALVLILYWIMFCLSVIFRRQWVDIERFTFPLVQIPAEMMQISHKEKLLPSIFRNNIMWIGFAIPVVIHTLNGLKSYFPSVPGINLWFSLDRFLMDKPWDAMRPFPIQLYLSVIGFSYLITLEVGFSLWFFFLIYKAECAIGSMLGFSMAYSSGGHARAFAAYQEIGGYIALVCFILFAMKNHLRTVLVSIFSGKNNRSENEPIPSRYALIGFVIGIILYTGVSVFLGMSLGVALSIIILFCMVCIVLTWVVTNGGLLLVHYSLLPEEFVQTVVGSRAMGANNLTILALQSPILMRDLREFMMSNFLNGFKLSDSVSLKRRNAALVMAISIIIALGATYYSHLDFAYEHGGLNTGASFWAADRSFNRAKTLIFSPTKTDWGNMLSVGVGAVVMSLLLFMKRMFLWWPLHPIGYTMHSGYAIKMLWFSFFIGWFLKFMILRHGGLRIYRRMRPGFLGLALGETLIGGIWVIAGLITGNGYRITVG